MGCDVVFVKCLMCVCEFGVWCSVCDVFDVCDVLCSVCDVLDVCVWCRFCDVFDNCVKLLCGEVCVM